MEIAVKFFSIGPIPQTLVHVLCCLPARALQSIMATWYSVELNIAIDKIFVVESFFSGLTHRGRDRMATIFQVTYSKPFFLWKLLYFH